MTKEEILERLHQINESIAVMDSYKTKYIEGCIEFKDNPETRIMMYKTVHVNREVIRAALLVEKECLEEEYSERFVCRACGAKADVITVDDQSQYIVSKGEGK